VGRQNLKDREEDRRAVGEATIKITNSVAINFTFGREGNGLAIVQALPQDVAAWPSLPGRHQ
jgi:hypothetical protein